MSVITLNGTLNALGESYRANVNSAASLTFIVDDNGGGSTITFETSADNSVWSAQSVGVYRFSNGVLTAQGSTTTAKGVYWVDLTGVTYWRARVSTYVSGNVTTRVEENGAPFRSVLALLVTGLVAQGAAQATALPIQGVFNVFSTVAASTGAILPGSLQRNQEVVVKNNGANALSVYPPVGNSINGGAANAAASVAAGASARFIADGAGNYWSF